MKRDNLGARIGCQSEAFSLCWLMRSAAFFGANAHLVRCPTRWSLYCIVSRDMVEQCTNAHLAIFRHSAEKFCRRPSRHSEWRLKLNCLRIWTMMMIVVQIYWSEWLMIDKLVNMMAMIFMGNCDFKDVYSSCWWTWWWWCWWRQNLDLSRFLSSAVQWLWILKWWCCWWWSRMCRWLQEPD